MKVIHGKHYFDSSVILTCLLPVRSRFSCLPRPEATPWMILNVAENSGGKSGKRCALKQKGKDLS